MTKAKPDTKPAFDPNRNDFRRKLGYYLTGLAIGLFLLGILQVARSAAVNAQQGQQQNQQQGQPQRGPQGGNSQMAK